VLHKRGFTIIELLVVVSIIALLVGILLPAIGKARDQAQATVSQSNLRNIGTAHASYSAEFAGRQLTFIDDAAASYGTQATWFREYNR
jgi:prepilin-type N-terminal cleavage/methylation domain-containing protein